MRTTIQIDDDLFLAAKSIAAAENKTVGQVISGMLRKAFIEKTYRQDADDVPSFRVSESAAPLTPEMVRKADEDSE
ncbi:MAG: antitoxin [Acidobacteriota bacterium]|jgi:hypothetical protein|nr:antitoxin [Acidobacteriota bacterium]